jgi:hypothetical protein
LNRCTRLCRPLPNHSATPPDGDHAVYERATDVPCPSGSEPERRVPKRCRAPHPTRNSRKSVEPPRPGGPSGSTARTYLIERDCRNLVPGRRAPRTPRHRRNGGSPLGGIDTSSAMNHVDRRSVESHHPCLGMASVPMRHLEHSSVACRPGSPGRRAPSACRDGHGACEPAAHPG